jgi:para-nitrobenzyl esterase
MDAVKTIRASTETMADDAVEFKICVDGWSQEADALEVIRSGAGNNVPVMVGTNRDEFKLFVLRALPIYWRLLPVTTLDRLTHERFKPRPGTEARYDELYPADGWGRPADRWIAGVTDATYSCRGLAAAEAVSSRQPRTYYYRFDYDRHRFSKLVGAAHGTEIVFIFDTLEQKGIFNLYGPRELREGAPMVDIMMGYWTNFAKTGDPNGAGLPEWPAFNVEDRGRIFLDLPTEARPDFEVKAKCEFWADQGTGSW